MTHSLVCKNWETLRVSGVPIFVGGMTDKKADEFGFDAITTCK